MHTFTHHAFLLPNIPQFVWGSCNKGVAWRDRYSSPEGPTEWLVAESIYRRQGTESRKRNVSFSLDIQNATSVGGHRLQTEISSYSCSSGGRNGRTGDKGEGPGGRKRACYLALAQSRGKKHQLGGDSNDGKHKKKKIMQLGSSPDDTQGQQHFFHVQFFHKKKKWE